MGFFSWTSHRSCSSQYVASDIWLHSLTIMHFGLNLVVAWVSSSFHPTACVVKNFTALCPQLLGDNLPIFRISQELESHCGSPHATAARVCSQIACGRASHTDNLRAGSPNEPDDVSLTSENELGLKNEVSYVGSGSVNHIHVIKPQEALRTAMLEWIGKF